jgi:hypothetical protein
MQIRLDDLTLVADLLTFLRGNNCIAYVTGNNLDTIEAIRPHAFGRQEEDELRGLVEQWRLDHPEATIEFN